MAELQDELNKPSESQQRIIELSKQKKEQEEARAAADVAKAEAETKAAEAEKRAAFAEGFADVLSQNPAAKDFKADIQAKVMAGLSVEDATFAVLGKAGKLGGTPPAAPQSPAGGSATVNLPQGGPKKATEMTQDERRAQLADALEVT